jgi:hypothetical protein
MQNISDSKPAAGSAQLAALTLVVVAILSVSLDAHGVSGKDAVFLMGLKGRAIGPLLYLGAKHMVTGYDHLLFLVGVIFFLHRLKDVVTYVSLFTIGHSVTLWPRVKRLTYATTSFNRYRKKMTPTRNSRWS